MSGDGRSENARGGLIEAVRRVWPEGAAALEKLAAGPAEAPPEGQQDGIRGRVSVGLRMDRYEGAWDPEKEPVETRFIRDA